MITQLPADVQAGLDAAREAELKQNTRLRMEVDGASFPILRVWDGGFAVAADPPPPLRGLVHIHDGSRHLSHCLIVASEIGTDEIAFDHKRATQVCDEQPLDFFRAPDAPLALIEDDR